MPPIASVPFTLPPFSLFFFHFSIALSLGSQWLLAESLQDVWEAKCSLCNVATKSKWDVFVKRFFNVNNQNTFLLQIRHTQNVSANLEKSLRFAFYTIWPGIYQRAAQTQSLEKNKNSKYRKLVSFTFPLSVTCAVSLLPHSVFILLPAFSFSCFLFSLSL